MGQLPPGTKQLDDPYRDQSSVGEPGQITIAKAIREELGISAGDETVQRVEGGRIVIEVVPGGTAGPWRARSGTRSAGDPPTSRGRPSGMRLGTRGTRTGDRDRRRERQAAEQHRSVGSVIRDAVDAYTRTSGRSRREAAARLLATGAPVDDWPAMKAEVLRGATPPIE